MQGDEKSWERASEHQLLESSGAGEHTRPPLSCRCCQRRRLVPSGDVQAKRGQDFPLDSWLCHQALGYLRL